MSLEIVLVEDSADDATLLRRAFNVFESSPAMRVFNGSLEAFKYLTELKATGARNPDLLVLDLQLPDCPGNLLLKNLRNHAPHLKDVPVAVVSNHIPLREQIDQDSVHACFEKPFRYAQWKELAGTLMELALKREVRSGGFEIKNPPGIEKVRRSAVL